MSNEKMQDLSRKSGTARHIEFIFSREFLFGGTPYPKRYCSRVANTFRFSFKYKNSSNK